MIVVDPVHRELARGLVSLDATAEAEDQRALELGVTLLLDNMSQGSTCLPCADVDAIGKRFAQVAEPDDSVDALLVRFLELAQRERDSALIGPLGAAKPLIATPLGLYTHRLAAMEQQLADDLHHKLLQPATSYPEAAIRSALGALLKRPPRLRSDSGKAKRLLLSPEQQYAVLSAVHAPLTVIAGGPGTGKTSVVISLLRVFLALGGQPTGVALAAPTGKAAKRLHTSIQSQLSALDGVMPLERQLVRRVPAPSTLHRLLGYLPFEKRFRHNESRPLPHSLVVVDEVSMVDLALMTNLVSALGENTRLVLIGDPNQLPSVDAGAVLRDLVPEHCSYQGAWRWCLDEDLEGSAADPPHPLADSAVRLTRNYRMDSGSASGRNVLHVANQIMAGETRFLSAPSPREEVAHRRVDASALQFEGVELLRPSPRGVEELLDRWFESSVTPEGSAGGLWFLEAIDAVYDFDDGFSPGATAAIDRILQHLERSRILSFTHGGPTGASTVNALMHQRMLRRLSVDGEPAYVPGEPVVMHRNDYERQLFNGDLGVVLRVRLTSDLIQRSPDSPDHRFMVVFPRPDETHVVYHLDALRGDLALAHAITVHRSQGSEFDTVVVMLPDQDGPLVARETLYTAVTRSRRSVVLYGEDILVGRATTRATVRHSGLGHRLASHQKEN